ncbi:ABC transporter, permease protein [Bordetella bronchiseptica E014]|nr:ABC transporter, permease protein [Bordetella bronchiseptica E014]
MLAARTESLPAARRPRPARRATLVAVTRLAILAGFLAAWHVLSETGVLPVFFFGQPVEVARTVADWFASGEIYPHLLVTQAETLLSFGLGSATGLAVGLWLALHPFWAAVFDPFIKAINSMPRVVFAPIFAVWFGLGIGSKVALGVTLVFFVVFFNVYQGVRDVNPNVVASARMLGARPRDLLRHVYLPSATSWLFSSLHNAVGMAFVGAVIGEYLGSSAGVGYLILQAEGVFDINTVFAGIVVLTLFAVILDFVVSIAEKRLLSWQPANRP